eukprot:Pgem_evm2s14429
MGVARRFFRGANNAKNELILYMDDDKLPSQHYIQAMLNHSDCQRKYFLIGFESRGRATPLKTSTLYTTMSEFSITNNVDMYGMVCFKDTKLNNHAISNDDNHYKYRNALCMKFKN